MRTMRCLLLFVTAAVVTGGIAVGGEPGEVPEQLTPFGPFIGTWRYEGPLQEDLPEVAQKGAHAVFIVSWRRILDKQAIMYDWRGKVAGGPPLAGKGLIGWNAADEQIVVGSMSSRGNMSIGTMVQDAGAQALTWTAEGATRKGRETSFRIVITKTGKDTLTWQAMERTGGDVEGRSPVYEFKRVKRTKGQKAAK